ncbi:MAG: hypothetical protein WDO14_00885 [Bacteroidota bacterium]
MKYLLVLLIAFSAISCVDEQVKPVLQQDEEDTPPPPPPPIPHTP